VTFLPVLISRKKPVGWPPMYYKEEIWRASYLGQILQHPHPSLADKQSCDVYCELLREEFS
jgi:hypothetical protein